MYYKDVKSQQYPGHVNYELDQGAYKLVTGEQIKGWFQNPWVIGIAIVSVVIVILLLVWWMWTKTSTSASGSNFRYY